MMWWEIPTWEVLDEYYPPRPETHQEWIQRVSNRMHLYMLMHGLERQTEWLKTTPTSTFGRTNSTG